MIIAAVLLTAMALEEILCYCEWPSIEFLAVQYHAWIPVNGLSETQTQSWKVWCHTGRWDQILSVCIATNKYYYIKYSYFHGYK